MQQTNNQTENSNCIRLSNMQRSIGHHPGILIKPLSIETAVTFGQVGCWEYLYPQTARLFVVRQEAIIFTRTQCAHCLADLFYRFSSPF